MTEKQGPLGDSNTTIKLLKSEVMINIQSITYDRLDWKINVKITLRDKLISDKKKLKAFCIWKSVFTIN